MVMSQLKESLRSFKSSGILKQLMADWDREGSNEDLRETIADVVEYMTVRDLSQAPDVVVDSIRVYDSDTSGKIQEIITKYEELEEVSDKYEIVWVSESSDCAIVKLYDKSVNRLYIRLNHYTKLLNGGKSLFISTRSDNKFLAKCKYRNSVAESNDKKPPFTIIDANKQSAAVRETKTGYSLLYWND